MAGNFQDVTPAAPAGSTNAKWQTDGSGNVSAYVGPGLPTPVSFFVPGVNTNSQVLFSIPVAVPFSIVSGATGSIAKALVAATGSTIYTLKKNGSSFGTVTYAGSGTTGTFSVATTTSFAAGDILEVDAPGTADATLAGVNMVLLGART